MVQLFELIRTLVNSIPPCNAIDCVPDRFEDWVIQILLLLENWLASLFGMQTMG